MLTDEMEQAIAQTEAQSRGTAASLIKQRQATALLNKKIDAIGKATVMTKSTLAAVLEQDATVADEMLKVVNNQGELVDVSKDAAMTLTNVEETNAEILEALQQANENTDARKSTIDEHHVELLKQDNDNHEAAMTQLDVFNAQLNDLKQKLSSIDMSTDMNEILREAMDLRSKAEALEAERVRHFVALRERLDATAKASTIMFGMISTYSASLDAIGHSVKSIAERVDGLNSRADTLTPKAMAVTEEDIFQLFSDFKDKSEDVTEDVVEEHEPTELEEKLNEQSIARVVEDQDAQDAEVESEPAEEAVAEASNVEEPAEESAESVEEISEEELLKTRSHDKKKKSRWAFWK